MNSNKNIVASFKKLQISLQTNVNIPDSGTILPGAGSYEAGTSVQVATVPAQGYRFDHWGGGINSTVNPLNLMMDNNKTLTAYFVKIYNLTVNTPPNIGATVKGVGSYDAGTKTTISAKASVCPYAFDHWSGTDNDSINPTTVTMNGDKSVTVYFKQLTAGQAITKSARDTSNATDSISIPLNQYEWVSGQANGGDCHGYIKSPDGSTIADLGSISATANFSFNADVSGNYIIVIQTGGNTLGFYNYTVTYTVYHY